MTHETPYGTAAVSWSVDGPQFRIELTVPPNTTAEVSLPDGSAPFEVDSGRHSFERTVVVPAKIEKPEPLWMPEG